MSVTLHTTFGDLKIELYCEQCPKSCEVRVILWKLFEYRAMLSNADSAVWLQYWSTQRLAGLSYI